MKKINPNFCRLDKISYICIVIKVTPKKIIIYESNSKIKEPKYTTTSFSTNEN